MQRQTNYTGIDISKLFFDVAVPIEGKYRHLKFGNDETGFGELIRVLPLGTHIVMEASGPYYLRLACFLAGRNIAVSVVNPLVIRRFSQMRMTRAKTDRKDAVMIAEYGRTERPGAWQVPKRHVVALQQMETVLNGLTKERTSLNNQLESFRCGGMLDGKLERVLERELGHRDGLITEINQSMEALALQHYAQMLGNLESIPGMGKKTAMALIVLSGGFDRFDDHRKLSSYIGICPRLFESGTSVRGRSRICKMGMSRARALLYICAWSAKRCNKACRALYERLVNKGKPKKVALIAVANKLLKQALAIAKQKTKYNENYSNIICF
jgi:transposase